MESNNNLGTTLVPQTEADTNQPSQLQRNPFILGNTVEVDLQTLQDQYLVPVFSRDNVETISHYEFINTVCDAVQTHFAGQQFNTPVVRCSHEMKLRTKAGAGRFNPNDDCGSYMQRMMFAIEIPSIQRTINGNTLYLQVVGVRTYSETNLLGNSAQKQCFRIALGFVNLCCTNTLVRSDGSNLNIKVTNTADLYDSAMSLFSRYDYDQHLKEMEHLTEVQIDVPTLAQFLGRCKMYQQMTNSQRNALHLPEFILPEAQLNAFIRDYYTDENFGGFGREITAYQLYQLLTNYKNNYIDVALERSINCYETALGLSRAIKHEDDSWNWFIS